MKSGFYDSYGNLLISDEDMFREYMRNDIDTFNELLKIRGINPALKGILVLESSSEIVVSHMYFNGCKAIDSLIIDLPANKSYFDFFGADIKKIEIGRNVDRLPTVILSNNKNAEVSIPDNEKYLCENGLIYSLNREILYYAMDSLKNEEIILDNKTEVIDKYALFNTCHIKKIVGESIVDVGSAAFMESHIKEFYFPNLEAINAEVFDSCEIDKLYVPKLNILSHYAFRNCKVLKKIYVTKECLKTSPDFFSILPANTTVYCNGNLNVKPTRNTVNCKIATIDDILKFTESMTDTNKVMREMNLDK